MKKQYKALDSVYNAYGNLGTVVLHRGYDDKKRFEYFLNKNWEFIIRGKKNGSRISSVK